jgi:hypothetical protein
MDFQHFESNKIKYAPKSFENKIYKEAAAPSKDNSSSSHRRNAAAAYKSNPSTKQSCIRRNTQCGFWLYGSSELCSDSATYHTGDIHVLHIDSSAQSADGMRFVASVSHRTSCQLLRSLTVAIQRCPHTAQSYVGAAERLVQAYLTSAWDGQQNVPAALTQGKESSGRLGSTDGPESKPGPSEPAAQWLHCRWVTQQSVGGMSEGAQRVISGYRQDVDENLNMLKVVNNTTRWYEEWIF